MTKLDWEKQNKKEIPKEYLNDMERHSRKREAQKKYRLKVKKAKAIKRKENQKDRRQSFDAGKDQERHRIIKLLRSELGAGVDISETEARDKTIQQLIKLIEGETK